MSKVLLLLVCTSIIAISIVIYGFSFSQPSQAPEIIYEEKEQPMILVEFDSWGENINDSSEAIFGYFVFNFGNVEAKNVKAYCEITNTNDDLLKRQTFNIGNIASNSHEYQESIIKYQGNSFEEYGICYLESVDGDYINLYERLDDVK